jgi:hypothetical protein
VNSIPKPLWEAYQCSEYWIGTAPRALCLCVGKPAEGLRELIRVEAPEAEFGAATPWAYLTAWNPGSRRLPEAENRIRGAELEAKLRAACACILPGKGKDPEGQWPEEVGFLAVGLEAARAKELGREFGQYALLAGRGEGKVRLLSAL